MSGIAACLTLVLIPIGLFLIAFGGKLSTSHTVYQCVRCRAIAGLPAK